MGLLEQARDRLTEVLRARGLSGHGRVEVRCLQPEAAIGARASSEFVLKRGKERVIEARFEGAYGQAFTDQPSDWSGSLEEVLALDLSVARRRAVFVAAMNAVAQHLGLAAGTRHCQDEDPGRCGPLIAGRLVERFGSRRIGLVGLQPAILRALVDQFGADRVRVLDLNPENIGTSKSGVPIWDGQVDLGRLVAWCDVGLVTGSSVVNGTIDEIQEAFRAAGKPVVFFGNTISATAALVGLERLCPLSR